MEPKVAVVIVTFNRANVLVNCIISLLKIRYKAYEIIVVDNASTDGTSDTINSLFPSVRVIKNEENLGYTGGNNKGIKYALEHNYDYIMILNDDIVVDPDFMNDLVNVASSNPKFGLVCPKILCFEDPRKLFKEYGKYNFYLGMSYQSLFNIKNPEEIDLVPGASILAKKEAIQTIGLMDEKFFLYFDEGDLCYRIKKKGFKIIYVPSAKVYHKVSESFSGWANPVFLYYITRNELLFAKKHLNLLIFIPLWIPRFSFRIIYYFVKFRQIVLIKAILRGFYDFTRNNYGRVNLPKEFLINRGKD